MIMFERWWKDFERQIDFPEIYKRNEDEIKKAVGRCSYQQALEWVLSMFNTNMKEGEPVLDVEEEIKAELRR